MTSARTSQRTDFIGLSSMAEAMLQRHFQRRTSLVDVPGAVAGTVASNTSSRSHLASVTPSPSVASTESINGILRQMAASDNTPTAAAAAAMSSILPGRVSPERHRQQMQQHAQLSLKFALEPRNSHRPAGARPETHMIASSASAGRSLSLSDDMLPPLAKRRRLRESIATQELLALQHLQQVKLEQLRRLDEQRQRNDAVLLALVGEQFRASLRASTLSPRVASRSPVLATAVGDSNARQSVLETVRASPNAVVSGSAASAKAVPETVTADRAASNASDSEGEKNGNVGGVRFREYQAELWMEKLSELMEFRKAHGHTNVPHSYEANESLAQWVKRQRYQYKLHTEGKRSTLTPERINMLNSVDFIWNSHDAIWEERYNELCVYKDYYKDCVVPSTYKANPQLAVWVKRQRRQYKLLQTGKPSSLTESRIVRLNEIGFSWDCRKQQRSEEKSPIDFASLGLKRRLQRK